MNNIFQSNRRIARHITITFQVIWLLAREHLQTFHGNVFIGYGKLKWSRLWAFGIVVEKNGQGKIIGSRAGNHAGHHLRLNDA